MDASAALAELREREVAGQIGAALTLANALRSAGVAPADVDRARAVALTARGLLRRAESAFARDPELIAALQASANDVPEARAALLRMAEANRLLPQAEREIPQPEQRANSQGSASEGRVGPGASHRVAEPPASSASAATSARGGAPASTPSTTDPGSRREPATAHRGRPPVATPLRELAPAHRWIVAIDEVGTVFDPAASDDRRGRVVAVVHPEHPPITDLGPDFHAAETSERGRRAALHTLARARAATFGLDASQVFASTDGWVTGIVEALSWVVATLPVPDKGTITASVFVEQRGGHHAGASWPAAATLIADRVSAVSPDRGRRLKLVITVVGKGEARALAYADVVANAWGGPSDKRRASLRPLGLDLDLYGPTPSPRRPGAPHLGSLWRLLDRSNPFDAEAWRWSLTLPSPAASVLAWARDAIAERLAANPADWDAALAAALRHLEDKALSMWRAGLEAEALRATAAPGRALPPRVELAWAVGRLALFNHRGGDGAFTDEPLVADIERRSASLFDEHPELVCLADLHRAVHHFNRCDLANARAAIARWRELPVAVGGLRMRGRVASTEGQHLAFEGRLDEAIARFDHAIALFERLSDPREAAGEIAQTRTYRSHALIDAAGRDDAEVAQAIVDHLGPIDAAIDRLAAADEAPDVWGHHVLLRWLVYRAGTSERDRYLDRRRAWRTATAWPWPVIEAYRAALLMGAGRREQARERLLAGAGHALEAIEHGPALWLVGAGLLTAAEALGEPWETKGEQLEVIEQEMPGARPWVERLRAVGVGAEVAVVVRDGLPWGFR